MAYSKYNNYNKSKYKNKSCSCWSDHLHDSRGEAEYCNVLQTRLKAGEIKEYKTQVRYIMYVNDKKVTTHIVDFVVVDLDGSESVHEYKGFATDVWKLKHKLFEACYPDIPYNVIYHR